METLYQLLNAYFMERVSLRDSRGIHESLDFNPAKKIATFTKTSWDLHESLAFTAHATRTALGIKPHHDLSTGIETLVRAESENHTIYLPKKAVYGWVEQMDGKIMAGQAQGVYRWMSTPLVLTIDTLYGAKTELEPQYADRFKRLLAQIENAKLRRSAGK